MESAQSRQSLLAPAGAELKRLRRERDELKEAVASIETELMQVSMLSCPRAPERMSEEMGKLFFFTHFLGMGGGSGEDWYPCSISSKHYMYCSNMSIILSFIDCFSQIQMDAKTLADDRDNFKLLYEQVYT